MIQAVAGDLRCATAIRRWAAGAGRALRPGFAVAVAGAAPVLNSGTGVVCKKPRVRQKGTLSMTVKSLCLAGALLALSMVPASAHHSFAMFDSSKTVELTGVVKEFLWVNPHSWLQVVTTDAQGKSTEWSIEMAATAALTRDGFTATKVRPGDKVTVTAHPLRDGSPSGQFLSVVLPSGQKLSHVYRDTAR
jgi:hypothetical protein